MTTKKGKASSRIRETASRAAKYMPRLKAAAAETGTVVGFAALGSLASGYRGDKTLQLWKGTEKYKKVTDIRLVGGVLGMVAALWKPSKVSSLLVNASTGLITSYTAEMARGYGAKMGAKVAGFDDDDDVAESGTLREKIQRAGQHGRTQRVQRLEQKFEGKHGHESSWARQHPQGAAARALPGGSSAPQMLPPGLAAARAQAQAPQYATPGRSPLPPGFRPPPPPPLQPQSQYAPRAPMPPPLYPMSSL